MKLLELAVNESLIINVIPNPEYEILISTKDVAKGYDVKPSTLSSHKHHNKNELVEGKHFVLAKGIQILDTLKNIQPHQIFWTKAGVLRLGMFIHSERAKIFRDWAEQVILDHLSSKPISNILPAAPKRRHNRLTQERLLSIMQDVCLIEDSDLRIRISTKLLGN